MKTPIKTVLRWIVNNLLTILQIVMPTIIFLFRKYIVGDSSLSKLDWLLILIVILELLIMIGKFIWDRKSFCSYYYPWSKIATNYIVEKKTVSYVMNEKEELEYYRSMTIKSKISSLDSILDKYIWTGIEKAKIPKKRKGIQAIESETSIGIWNYFRIIFDDRIQRGETKEIKYQWPNIKQCMNSSAFFSVSTDEPTKEIELILKLGKKYANHEIKLEEFRAIESDNPISVETVPLSEEGKFTWNIKHPRRFRYYRIRWSWNEANVPDMPDQQLKALAGA